MARQCLTCMSLLVVACHSTDIDEAIYAKLPGFGCFKLERFLSGSVILKKGGGTCDKANFDRSSSTPISNGAYSGMSGGKELYTNGWPCPSGSYSVEVEFVPGDGNVFTVMDYWSDSCEHFLKIAGPSPKMMPTTTSTTMSTTTTSLTNTSLTSTTSTTTTSLTSTTTSTTTLEPLVYEQTVEMVVAVTEDFKVNISEFIDKLEVDEGTTVEVIAKFVVAMEVEPNVDVDFSPATVTFGTGRRLLERRLQTKAQKVTLSFPVDDAPVVFGKIKKSSSHVIGTLDISAKITVLVLVPAGAKIPTPAEILLAMAAITQIDVDKFTVSGDNSTESGETEFEQAANHMNAALSLLVAMIGGAAMQIVPWA